MALSADTPMAYELGSINTLPVKASTLIYEGAAVGDDGAGYMRGLVAGDSFRGFAQRQADNSDVATDGAINVNLITNGMIPLTISGIAITDVEKPVYASDDGTFTLTKGSNSLIGYVRRYVSTNTCIVAFCNKGEAIIPEGAVESSMLANGAGVAALLAAGLGGSVSVTKASVATDTVVAADATKDRACLVIVTVDETYAKNTGTAPTVKIGEDDTIEKCMADTVLDTEAAGVVLAFAFTNTATKKIIVTTTAAIGDATGGCTVTVLAIPTT